MVALGLSACGGSGDFEAPTCEPGEVRAQGRIGGTERDFQADVGGYVFFNAFNEENGVLAVGLDGDPAQPELYLEFPAAVANGDSVEARGNIDLGDGMAYGNCETGDFVSILRKLDQGGQFLLEDIRMAPYCDNSPVDGSLAGCFSPPAN